MKQIKILHKAPALNLKNVVRLHNREYSMFTMSACLLTFAAINKQWAKSCFNTVVTVYRRGVTTMFRNRLEEDSYERTMAKIITEDKKRRRAILAAHLFYARKLIKFFKEIKERKNFSSAFVKKFNETFGHLCIYVMAIHRGLDYIPSVKKYQSLRNLLIKRRTKYEYLMGDYDEYFGKLCSKIGKVRDMSPKLLNLLTVDEFVGFLDKNKLPDNLAGRNRCAVLILLPRYSLVQGKAAVSLFAKLQKQHEKLHRDLLSAKIITGAPVYPKVVKGKVQVIVNPKDFVKFKPGNILVTVTTLPKYTHIIAKAKGIVADEGTLLSHAAILSRELKIPAIVGTKIATRVLRDGDKVEVDAEKGIVRKL